MENEFTIKDSSATNSTLKALGVASFISISVVLAFSPVPTVTVSVFPIMPLLISDIALLNVNGESYTTSRR